MSFSAGSGFAEPADVGSTQPTPVRPGSGINQVLELIMPIMGSREHPEEAPPMLKDGTYAAWFRTPLGQGTGIVHVAHGKIWGRDGVMTYGGTCEVVENRFTLTITTKRHTEGLPTVFGDDQELAVKLEGTCAGKLATYAGTAEQFPGVILEGMLLFSEQQPPRAAEAREPIPKFAPAKLPKLPKRFR